MPAAVSQKAIISKNVMERASPVGRLLEVNTFPSSTYDPRGDAEAFLWREKFFQRRRVQRA